MRFSIIRLDHTLFYRNGSLCYEYSHNRLVILNAIGVGGFTSQARFEDTDYTRWVISPYSDLETSPPAGQRPAMTITIDSINTTCPDVSGVKFSEYILSKNFNAQCCIY